MDRSLKFSSILIYIVSGVALVFAALYIFSPTIMPYHQKFLNKAHEELDPKIAELLLDLMGVGGSGFLTYGLVLILLTNGPFKNGKLYAWKIIIVASLSLFLPLQYFTLIVGWYSPWWVVTICLSLILIAAKISRPYMN